MMLIKQSESIVARRRIPIYLVDATNGYTPETGVLTPTIEISKNGASQISGSGNWNEVGDGLYYYETTADDVDTIGFLSVRIIKSGVSREFAGIAQIIGFDPYDNKADEIDAIKSKTDNLPADPADESLLEAAITSSQSTIVGEINANEVKIDGVKAKTDLLPASPANEVTVAAIKAKTDLLPVSPANEITVAAIKAKTDALPADTTSETNATSNKVAVITEINANEVKIDAIKTKTDAMPANTSDILNRIVGLVQENFYIDNATHNASNRLTAGRMRTYSNPASVGTDNNVLAIYLITATYDSNGNLQTYSVIKQ